MSNNFHESHWGQCLELLSHLCQYGEDILLVSGPSGIGKTTMQQELMELESQNFVFCPMDATPDLTADEISEQIEIVCNNSDKKDVLLLIDDAQHLDLETITLLMQLKQRTTTPLHIVLFATPELQQKISRSVLKEDFAEQVHTIEIEPLTLVELEAFLMHQWRNAHNNSDLQLNKSKYKKIHAASGGIPGKALQVAKDILTGKSNVPNQLDASQRLSPFTVGVTVSFGILFCVLALIWPSAEEPVNATASNLPLLEPQNTIAAAEAVEVDPAPAPEVVPEPMSEPVPVEPAELPQPVPEPDPAPQPEIVSKSSDDEKIERLERKLQALQEQLNKEQNARRASELKLQQSIKKESLSKIAATKTKPLSFSTQEAHILALPSKNFALQLLGSNSEKKVQNFIKEHRLVGQAYYYKGIHKGRAWYVVVSGNYASKFEAQQALARLPYSLRKFHPWPRQYSKIHDSIKARNSNG